MIKINYFNIYISQFLILYIIVKIVQVIAK